MKDITVLCGPAGSGKTTYRKLLQRNDPSVVVVSQDEAGRDGHLKIFEEAISLGQNIVIDRMSFDKKQRARYLTSAKEAGYTTKIVVLHENKATCLERMLNRKGHETIQDEKSARGALHTFFTKYERPTPDEADEVVFVYPEGHKPTAVLCDLDGTLCNIDHRLHFVQGSGKKDWKNFLYNIPGDEVNLWCKTLIASMELNGLQIVYCSGRGSEYRGETKRWLQDNDLYLQCTNLDDGKEHLYMRERGDHRTDYIVKEIILDFEILTRFTPLFAIDDRKQVVDMWRRRGITCLQCAEGNF
jgi:AAA domain